jgi:hypothetical protein
MFYTLTIDQKPGYLHAVVTGRNCKEAVIGYVEEILRECKVRDCFSVLIEERLEGPRLETLDVFQIVSEGSVALRGAFRGIAYVDVNAESTLMQFAENVAFNRGMPLAVFKTVAEAEKWLLEKHRGNQGPPNSEVNNKLL